MNHPRGRTTRGKSSSQTPSSHKKHIKEGKGKNIIFELKYSEFKWILQFLA
jgi:hypothetical protein